MPASPTRRSSLILLLAASAGVGCAARSGPAPDLVLGAAGPRCPADTGRTAAGLFYQCAGIGEPAIVFLHGFSMDRRTWGRELATFSGLGRLVAYDLRGHGRSAPIAGAYTSVADLEGLLDELGVRRAHLVGLSNGARIALDFGLTRPERVASLVLAGPDASGYRGPDPMPWMAPVIEAIRAGDLFAAADRWAATPLMSLPPDAPAEGVALIREMSRDNRSLWSLRANPEQPLAPPAIQRLADVRVPTLVIVGEHDQRNIRLLADSLARTIPGARLDVVPNAGHLVNLAAPRRFEEAVRKWIGGWADGRTTRRTDPGR